jgi:outer membrane immunogenic protein
MNRLGRLLSSAATIGVVLAASAQSGFAADFGIPGFAVPPPPPATKINWTGFYLGGDVGSLFTETHYSRPNTGLQEVSIGTIDSRLSYGVYGGFNYQVAPWVVLGIETNFNWMSAAYYRELGFQFDFLQQTRWVDTVTGRLGVLARPDTMLYVKGGPAWVNVAGVEGFGTNFTQTKNGVQGGVGVESLITRNVALRGEITYTYVDPVTLNSGFDVYRPILLTAQVGLAYKLDAPAGWGVPAAFDFSAPLSAPLAFKGREAPAVPTVPIAHWTGVEAGGFVSGNGNQVTFLDSLVAGAQSGPYTDFTVGGGWFVGANYQFYRFVIGVEGSGNYEKAIFNTATGTGGVVNFYRFGRVNDVLAFTGRIGVLATPDTLFYAKAGPANINFTTEQNFWNAIAPNPTTGTQNLPGYLAGVGVETYLLPHFSVRAEATYAHTDTRVVLNGVIPNEFTLQPSVFSATFGAALHL